MPGSVFQDDNGFVLEGTGGGVFDDSCATEPPCCNTDPLLVPMKKCGGIVVDPPEETPADQIVYVPESVAALGGSVSLGIPGAEGCYCVIESKPLLTESEAIANGSSVWYSGSGYEDCCECLAFAIIDSGCVKLEPSDENPGGCCCDVSGWAQDDTLTATFTSFNPFLEIDGVAHTSTLTYVTTISGGTRTTVETFEVNGPSGFITTSTLTGPANERFAGCGAAIWEAAIRDLIQSGCLFWVPSPASVGEGATVTADCFSATASFSGTSESRVGGVPEGALLNAFTYTANASIGSKPGVKGCGCLEEPAGDIMADPLGALPMGDA